MKRKLLSVLALLTVVAAGAYAYQAGHMQQLSEAWTTHNAPETPKADPAPLPPAVTVARATKQPFTETVMVTGTLVARDEILVAPEIEGLRVLELKKDEGDRVKKGDVLATLVPISVQAQVAQSDASLARADAAIARARSAITESAARLKEAEAALQRAQPLTKSGYLSESTFDQRDAAAKTARAQLAASEDGIKLAEAEKAQVVAQRRELDWRLGNTDVKAPEDGIVSRRTARVGGLALSAGEPMFHIVARGEIELDAEVPEEPLAKVQIGQQAEIAVAGVGTVSGKVRLVSPEVNKTTRLGRVRIFMGDDPSIRIGAFGRGVIKTAHSEGLAVPASSVLYGENGATVQIVRDGKVETTEVVIGLMDGSNVEVRNGLKPDDMVVARAGTFLREGDAVRAILPGAEISNAAQPKDVETGSTP